MPPIPQIIQRIIELLKRYPGVIALGGFLSGIGSFILVDRQAGLASWIAILLLVSWIWLMLENTLTGLFARTFKREIPQPLLRYATQMIHQESLFFVLPFFFITTTWNSGQLVFTGLLGAAGLISIVDPLYYRWLAPRRWLFLALHTLTLFAALLTALPIILHLTTAQSFKLALIAAMVLSFPSLASSFPINTWRRGVMLVVLTLAIGGGGWLLRSWVPPATLWMTEVAVTTQMQDREPGESLDLPRVAAGRQGSGPHCPGHPWRAQRGLSGLDPQAELPAQSGGQVASAGADRGRSGHRRAALQGGRGWDGGVRFDHCVAFIAGRARSHK